jgi:hypothetical protein
MSELAFNMNGEPFDVPANATGWRVRRVKPRGAPEVVYAQHGVPLVIPIDATVEDLRDAVGSAGRYRIDPVEDYRPIPNAPHGYVYVRELETAPPAPPSSGDTVMEAMRMNAEIAKLVVEQFPPMMLAAAQLLRAADGAGLPARAPILTLDDDVDDEQALEDSGPGTNGLDVEALVGQLVPVLVSALSGKGKLDLPSLVDWRKAAKTNASLEAPSTTKPTPSAMAIEPATMAHLLAVQASLDPKEVTFVREVAKELGPDELRGWLDQLRTLSVPDAVRRVRGLIAGQATKGDAA